MVIVSIYVPTISSDETSLGSGTFLTTLYVGGTGAGNYSSIQSAYNDASNGDTIYVYNGTYYEKLTIEKSIDLVGEEKYTTILDGDSDWNDIIRINNAVVNISGFTITNSGLSGITFLGENNIHIFDNIFMNNFIYGIYSYESTNIFIENNTFINDGSNIVVDERDDWDSFTIQNNTVNGKPLRFYHSMNNFTIPSDTGATIIGNCTNVTIHQINLTYSCTGIIISYSSNITISSNILTNNGFSGIYIEASSDVYIHQNNLSNNLNGVYLYNKVNRIFIDNNEIQSNNDTGILIESIFEQDSELFITNNTIKDNCIDGIAFYTLVWCHVYIKNNLITTNSNGIYLGYMVTNAIIIGNRIINNNNGIKTTSECSGTICYHNELSTNNKNVYGDGGNSGNWDDGYPSGGNYWDDYTGNDFYHGVNQDIPGSDGIGDTPYQVVGDYVDNYPFMAPFGMKMVSGLEVQWNLISLPFNATVGKTQLQYYYNDTFYSWNETTTNENPTEQPLISPYYFDWDRINQTYQFKSTLSNGYGYWFFAFQPGVIWVEDQNDTTDRNITTVYQGWNLVSIPYNYSVNKNEIFVNGTDWATAVSNGWMNDYIFGWNQTGQNYEFIATFEPGKSYWLFASQVCILHL